MSVNEFHPEYIIDGNGEKKSVVLPIDEYEALVEDLVDLGTIAERRDETSVSHADVLEELKRDGLLAY
jgi:hypothetical protein